jgi:hypothetical protein
MLQKLSRGSYWALDQSGKRHLILKFEEVLRSPKNRGTQSQRGREYFETSKLQKVIQLDVSKFQIVGSGEELTTINQIPN